MIMMCKSIAKNEYRCNIFRLRATPAAPIGSVDAACSIKKAIDVFEITDPQKQKRLVARRQ